MEFQCSQRARGGRLDRESLRGPCCPLAGVNARSCKRVVGFFLTASFVQVLGRLGLADCRNASCKLHCPRMVDIAWLFRFSFRAKILIFYCIPRGLQGGTVAPCSISPQALTVLVFRPPKCQPQFAKYFLDLSYLYYWP